jgi:sugar lactone lactonase YvrE
MTTHPKVELLVASGDDVGESPVWDADAAELRWTDITGRRIHRWSAATGSTVTDAVDREVGFLAHLRDGGWLAGARDGIARLDGDRLDLLRPIVRTGGSFRLNDGKPDPWGRLWFGSMTFGADAGLGQLHRLDVDGTLTTVLDGLTIPNGLGWSTDRSRMYFVESTWRRVEQFDLDPASGEIVGRGVFVELSGAAGVPDGLCVDADDHVWIAMWGGGHVRRHRPDGGLDVVVEVPASQPASICIGGPDGTQAFVTTAAHGLDADVAAGEGAGHVYGFIAPAPGQSAGRAAVPAGPVTPERA